MTTPADIAPRTTPPARTIKPADPLARVVHWDGGGHGIHTHLAGANRTISYEDAADFHDQLGAALTSYEALHPEVLA